MKNATKLGLVALLTMIGAAAAITPAFSGHRATQALAEGTQVSDWKAFKEAVKKAKKGDTIVLIADVTSGGGGDDRIVIDGKTITIDLNGHTVNRNRSKNASNGHAFEIQGDSTVTIASSSGEATVTGGYAEHGGAVNVHEGSTATFHNVQFVGNKANSDGGAIFNRGHLIMQSCTIRECEAKDTGGAIYNTDEGWFELDRTTITNCVAKNDGGAIKAHLKKEASIRNSAITHNKSKTEYGGAIVLDASKKVLSIYDTTISDNQAKENGGAIYVNDGSIKLYGATIRGNSGADGGGVYFDGGDNDIFEICEYGTETVFDRNYASKDGGAIFSRESTMTVNGARFEGNVSAVSGGAVRVRGGVANIANATFTKNETKGGFGGGLFFANSAVVNLGSSTFKENYASHEGGAVYFHEDGKSLKIQGAIVAEGNLAGYGNNFHMAAKKTITVVGSLEGSTIGVSRSGRIGVFATGYAEHNETSPTAHFFGSETGTTILSGANGLRIGEGASTVDPYLLFPFVPADKGYDTNRRFFSSANWMAGIDGNRYLNEINIPATHDTAMRRVAGRAGVLSTGGFADEYAVTQERYIPEQYEEGVRYLDVRLHNRYPVDDDDMPDDGINLWQCHGKTTGGTYWAGDENNNLVNLKMVLNWTKSFLTRNPTECIIMGFTLETYRKKENPIITARLYEILSDFIDSDYLNPSTGEPLVYLEDGDLSKTYTHMPQLKDVRGKILLMKDGDWEIGGFRDVEGTVGLNKQSQSTGYKVWWDVKRDDVNKFFSKPEHQLSLPKVGQAWEHHDTIFTIGLNCAPQQLWPLNIPDETPIYHSSRLLPALFWDPKGCFFDIKGKYIGWVKTDGATAKEWTKIWRSNYWQDDADFVTVTVDPNLNDENYQIKEYRVPVGTEITIPDFNYRYDEKLANNFFQYWSVGDTHLAPGAAYKLDQNTKFVANWGSNQTNRNVSIYVDFQDCDDIDGMRPESMDFTVNGSEPFAATKANSWHAVYNGILESIVPVWDKLGEGEKGKDTPTTYRYEVTGDIMAGYTFTFIHTSAATADKVVGTVQWYDQDDYDKLRPGDGQLTIALVDTATGNEVDTHTFTGGDWSYELGGSAPKYRDGNLIDYRIKVSDASTWADLDEYVIKQVDNNVTAYHEPTKTALTVNIRWIDDGTSRPASVTLHIKANGVETGTETIVEIVDGEQRYWHAQYLLDGYEYPGGVQTPIVYSIAVDVPGYTTVIKDFGDDTFEVTLKAEGQEQRIAEVERVIALIDAIGDVAYTKECIAKLDEARTAYDLLANENKALVTNYFTLVSAEREFDQKFSHLVEIDAEIAALYGEIDLYKQSERVKALNKLGIRVLDLEEAERNALFNRGDLNEALAKVGSLQAVINAIDAIGDVSATDACKARIAAAEIAYNALSDEDKSLIENHDALIAAQALYFGKDFLSTVENALAQAGANQDVAAALDGIWNEKATPDGTSFREKWDALSEEAKLLLRGSVSEDAFAEFRTKYIGIEAEYSAKLKPFTDGPTFTPAPAPATQTIASAAYWWIFVGVLAAAVLAAGGITSLVFSHKKKHDRPTA